jgi:lipopolysaccharide heptosyltransferase I
MQDAFKNILIIKPSSLGDIVLALPALSALGRSFPDARISWLIRPEFAPLLENHPHLTETIFFDRKLLAKAWFHPGAFCSLISLIRRLRRKKFDAVFDFQGLLRTAALAWLSGCKNRFGMANARELAHLFYTHKVEQDQDCVHLVDYYLKIVRAAGASDLSVEFVLSQDSGAAVSVGTLLREHDVEPDKYVVFVPGSTDPDKRWPVERFAALADKIASQFHLSIVAAGATSEGGFIESLKSLAHVPVANFAGRTSLGELIALLRAARLVVSNDTGPGHIAAALGTPLVLMYSWSNPARIAPYGRPECMIAREPYGRGLDIKSTDPRHNVRNITVDEVYQKVCEQIRRSPLVARDS